LPLLAARSAGFKPSLRLDSNWDCAQPWTSPEQTWTGASEMRERMLAAAQRATVPVLLIQAENDYDLAPTRALDEELKRAGKPHRVEIFLPFGRTHQGGHELCVRGGEIWAPTVFSFLDNAMK
jgi:pimeloyl-ACP methyl ester carboxylesterase